MRYYKLIDPFDVSVRLYLPYQKSGVVKHEVFILKPGKKYVEHMDDELFMSELLNATKEIPYTDERKAALDEYGAKYEVKVCKPCQGRIKKLKVWFAEVVE